MRNINVSELRTMKGKEGLILQGCGGDLQEWVVGINEMLTEDGILLDGSKFNSDEVVSFQNEELTNLLFPFTEDVKLNMGKLAMWRLQTHSQFSGKWLSDYVDNRLGGFIDQKTEQTPSQKEKPDCPLIGQNGNIYNLIGIAATTLRENGMSDEATEMKERIFASGSYDMALCIIGEYVNITSVDDDEGEGDDEDEDEYFRENEDEDYDYDEDEDEGMGGM